MAKKVKYKNIKPLNQEKFQINRFSNEYITSADKSLVNLYNDPLNLNFKLMIDFTKTSGLFANEKFENSALAYLKRIGDIGRMMLLEQFIQVLQTLVKDFDYLLMNVEGLDNVKLSKPWESFNEEEDKINFIFNETSDMLIESLISTYRSIWFDEDRCVEVLPSNLRKFDFSVIVYSANYYKLFLYDDAGEEKPDVEKLIFPTKRKLSNPAYYDKFNHILFKFTSAQIDITESGRSFFDSISNEPGGDFTKNNISLSYKFATIKGRFNNIFGEVDYVALMAILSAQNKMMGAQLSDDINDVKFPDKKKFKDKLKAQLKKSFNNLKQSTIKTLNKKATNTINAEIDKINPFGNLLESLTFENMEDMVKNTIDLGIDKIEQKLVTDPLTKVNNMLFFNFSNNLYDLYKNNFGSKNVDKHMDLINNNNNNTKRIGQGYNPEKIGPITKGISFGTGNVYNRKSF